MYESEVAGWVDAAHKAASVDVALIDEGSLLTGAVGLAEAISGLEAALAHVAGELDRRGTCEREAGLVTGSWLARESRLPKGRARRSISVGRRLADLPVIDDAVADGRLTVEHAAFLARCCNARVLDAVVLVQDQIVDWAGDCTFEIWARQVGGLIDLLDEDGAHDPERDDPASELNVADTLDGVTHLAGRFAGADAVLVRQAIEGKADELFHRAKRDRDGSGGAIEVPSRPMLRAQALVELCRLANATDPTTSRAARPDITLIVCATDPLEPARQPDDDPLDGGGDAVEGDGRRAGDPTPIDDPFGDESTASASPSPLFDPSRPRVTDLTGTRLQDATTRALLCDPDLHALVVDRLGVPLDLGRTTRFATDAQRRALAIRDGGCVFPGCDRPPGWCDAHHVTPHDHGGTTDLPNLALLCRRHHGISHRNDWTMHTTDDGWFWWAAPNGQTFWSQRHGHRRTDPTPT